jgi:hypothetical protein
MHPERGRIAPDEVSNRVQDRERVKLFTAELCGLFSRASLNLCANSVLVAAARQSCSANLASAKNPRSIEGLLAELEACAHVALFPAQESLRL